MTYFILQPGFGEILELGLACWLPRVPALQAPMSVSTPSNSTSASGHMRWHVAWHTCVQNGVPAWPGGLTRRPHFPAGPRFGELGQDQPWRLIGVSSETVPSAASAPFWSPTPHSEGVVIPECPHSRALRKVLPSMDPAAKFVSDDSAPGLC